jgi:hypothetical protein
MAVNARVNSRAGFAAAVPMVFLLAASVLSPRPAVAQQARRWSSRHCLCEQEAITVLHQRVDTSKATYDERTQREQRLSQQIEQMQGSIGPNDLSAQDQLRELLDLWGRVSRDRMETALPAGSRRSGNLNVVVQDYNANCLKPIYTMDVKKAQASLSCPVVP